MILVNFILLLYLYKDLDPLRFEQGYTTTPSDHLRTLK